MAQEWHDIPGTLDFKFDAFGGSPRIVDGGTGKSLTLQQIVHAYNTISNALVEIYERLESGVD